MRISQTLSKPAASQSSPARMAARAAARIAFDAQQRKQAAAIRAENALIRLLTTKR